MSPIKSRTDSTFFGSFQGIVLGADLGEVNGDMSALGYRLNAPAIAGTMGILSPS